MTAMDVAKASIKESLKDRPILCAVVIECFEKRWGNQMEQKLYGAALYLNPGKFFALRDKDRRQAARLRSMFNDVLWKVGDDDEQTKISKKADDYERSEGECFSNSGAIRDRNRKILVCFLTFDPCSIQIANDSPNNILMCISVLW
jgi:hypothetical protein